MKQKAGRLAAALGLLLVATVTPTFAGGVTVAVKAGELYFDPKSLGVEAGEVAFTVVNEGAIEHNFAVQDARGRTLAQIAVIAPGTTERVGATLAPGTYRIVCTYPGHTEAGMTGTLTVK